MRLKITWRVRIIKYLLLTASIFSFDTTFAGVCNKALVVDALDYAFQPKQDIHQTWVLITDFPTELFTAKNQNWKDRHRMLVDWKLQILKKFPNHTVFIYTLPFSGNHNAAMSENAYLISDDGSRSSVGEPLDSILSRTNLVVAASEFSMTAPLTTFAKKYQFQAATMPGFTFGMQSALFVNFLKLAKMTERIQQVLNETDKLQIRFKVSQKDDHAAIHDFTVDLRDRVCRLGNCQIRAPGEVSNLPGGETFIVPYEGEKEWQTSITSGSIPVQVGNEIIIYKVQRNKTIDILGEGPEAERERALLKKEPAYGNIAEIGFGVLRSLGVKPIENDALAILLNEKLGLHIAWGMSSHFPGGSIGPEHFNEQAIHLDRVFIPELMKSISVQYVDAFDEAGRITRLIENDSYTKTISDH